MDKCAVNRWPFIIEYYFLQKKPVNGMVRPIREEV